MTKRLKILKKLSIPKSVKRYFRQRRLGKFRTILRNQKRFSKYGTKSYKASLVNFTFDTNIKHSNFGIFIPEGPARNADGTPKMFDAEKAKQVWYDEPMMWKEGTPPPAAATPVTITITKDDHYKP